jgi:heptosyltransferase-2
MNIVCFGQSDWGGTWVTKQQLLSRLVSRGHRVLFVNPIAPPSPHAPSKPFVEEVRPGLHVLTLPPRRTAAGRIAQRLYGPLTKRRVRQAAERLGLWAPVVLCLWPDSRWLVESIDRSALIYFAEDDNSAFGGMGDGFARRQQEEERRLVEEADVVLAVSKTLLEKYQAIRADQGRCYLQENGVALGDFSVASMSHVPRNVVFERIEREMPHLAGTVGFAGQIDERMDQNLVCELAERRRDVAVVLAGPVKQGVDVSKMLAQPNIYTTGRLCYDELGGVYGHLDVGLVPYVLSPLTRSCNPLKAYEYLAADLPTVATYLPGLNSVGDAAAVCETNADFLDAVDFALEHPSAKREERSAVARSASWQRRTDQLEARLQEAEHVARARRIERNCPEPRIDRPGRQAVQIEPRLDGKDRSVRTLGGNYEAAQFSGQQLLVYRSTRVLGRLYYLARRGTRLLKGDTRRVARILVVRNGQLGDTVVFGPTLRVLRRQYPDAKIIVAIARGNGMRTLLEGMPEVDGVIELGFFNDGRKARWKGALRLMLRGFDLVVGGVWYFNMIEGVFSGAPLRLGLYDGHPLQAYADRVVPLDPTMSEADNNTRLVETVAGPASDDERTPRLALDEPAVAKAADGFIDAIGLSDFDGPIVAMHPGSKRPSRRWPAREFARLAERLLRERPNLRVVFTGAGADEKDLLAGIIESLPDDVRSRGINAFQAGSLLGLIGFYDRIDCLVSNDTGVMHVARARGVPLVAVIGPENDRRWGPYPLGRSSATVVRQEVPGTPHNLHEDEWNLSLSSISAERVLPHVQRTLDETTSPTTTVTRDVERHGFEQLAALGLKLPRLAWILPERPSLLGLTTATAGDLSKAIMTAVQQRYPQLDVVVVIGSDTPMPDMPTSVKVIRGEAAVGSSNATDATWSKILSATRAEALTVVSPADRLEPEHASHLASAYLRGPIRRVVSVDGPVRESDAVAAWSGSRGEALSQRLLFSREMLIDLLAHPLPLPPEVPVEEAPAFVTRAA